MPKRPNPFGDYCPLQLKSHIGEKEVDLSGNKEQMQTVYERTKQLLFSGSKSVGSSPCKNPDPSEWRDESPTSQLPTRPLPGQMTLDFSGALRPPQQRSVPYAEPTQESMDTDQVQNNNNIDLPKGQMLIDASGRLRMAPNLSDRENKPDDGTLKLMTSGEPGFTVCDLPFR